MQATPNRGINVTRTETFVDAAFAFAVTLLVISVDGLPSDIHELREAFKSIPAFAMSFAIIVVFWINHHRWSRRFGLDDLPTALLSVLLVFLVLVYVYPLRIMADTVMHELSLGWLPAGLELQGPEDLVFIYTAYGLGFASLSGAMWLLHLHGWRQRVALGLGPLECAEVRADLLVLGLMASVGLLSTLLANLLPMDRLPWLLGIPGLVYNLLFFLPWLASARVRAVLAKTTRTGPEHGP